jgi:hypothetical protein
MNDAKVIVCQHCGREYDDKAAKCPSCWKTNRKPAYVGKAILGVLMLGIGFGFYRGCVYNTPGLGQPASVHTVEGAKFVADGLSRKVLSDLNKYGAPNCEDLSTLIREVRVTGGDTNTWEQLQSRTSCTHDRPWVGN